ncbi:MAG: LysM peptidoglycan-binding domain-containing protein [Thermoanaerobaculia bacterium]
MTERKIWSRLAVGLVATLAAGCAGQGPAPVVPPLAAEETAPAPPAEPLTPTSATQEMPAPAGDPSVVPGELSPDDELALDENEATSAETEPEPATLLHESLDRFESSKSLWEQGDLDGAFAALDDAYALMAKVPPSDDALLAQEKENLRQLISRRVVEIYASRQTAVGNPNASIPLVINDDVEREIRSFQGHERSFFLDSYARSGLYRPMIVRELAALGLPEQLSWLPLVESGFKERALSSARALGLWQFIASTGYRYGLDRSDWIDERMDPEKSTRAAIAYLTALHDLFGDWLPALAAYNCGEGQVLRQINRQSEGYFDQFWDLYARLPSETRRYVPRFLATLAILDDPAKYGFELPEPMTPVETETIPVTRAAKLESLDATLGFEKGTLAKLNPELRRNATPKTTYELRVPKGQGETLVAQIESIPEWTPPKVEVGTHRVRSGETLGQIAARYRTSVKTLQSMNNLRSANRLSIGQILRVPVSGGASRTASSKSATRASTSRERIANGETVQYRVREGDSLWKIAVRYGTTAERIRADNNLTSNLLRVGQLLVIRAGAERVGG